MRTISSSTATHPRSRVEGLVEASMWWAAPTRASRTAVAAQ
ncbi:hypothetical protein [Actinomyces wuliandei]|nr:hypothetical protein [Actinomyces wuliandei]